MADQSLSQLTAASALGASDLIYVVQAAASRKATGAQVVALATAGLGTASAHPATDFAQSISLATPNVLYATPVTFTNTAGAFAGTLTLNTQAANLVFAGPATGVAATPTMRPLVAADLPLAQLDLRYVLPASAAITGGTIDGATIGGTTPASARAYRPTNAQAGTSYSLVLADDGKMVTLSNAAAITLTVPPNSSVAFPVGAEVDLAQLGAGQVTVAAGSGVTIVSYQGKVAIAGQYAGVTLKQISTNQWLLIGNLA